MDDAKGKYKPDPGFSADTVPIDLESFDAFRLHPWVSPLIQRYTKDATLARHAVARIVTDLENLNKRCIEKHGRVSFTSVEGRVKPETRFLRKLYKMCRVNAPTHGTTPDSLHELYCNIKDLCGVRFSCPYYDEVKPAIAKLVRPRLSALGYATDLQSDPRYQDADYLDTGDEAGYRSYHFFVRVPTVINIFGHVEMCLCEVQARTELQHIWAVKSHDLLYKPTAGWEFHDEAVVENMRQLSNNLRFADQLLVDIRNRVRGGGDIYEPQV
jgi:ppGpp synthetase/RelA/SpoT-type nucleotidyltranferase